LEHPSSSGGGVLDGPSRDAALRAALHVASKLEDPAAVLDAAAAATAQSRFPDFNGWFAPGLAQGNAGLGVLWAYLDTCLPGAGWDTVGKRHIEIAARAAERASFGTGLFSGLAGLAFSAWQLSRGGARYARLLASLDHAVASETIALASRLCGRAGPAVGEFDVISGLSGVGAYLLCRRGQPAIDAALAATVDALTSLALAPGPIPAWHTPAALLYDDKTREAYPHGNLNCGLAHGAPGVLAFLSLACTSGSSAPRVERAIAAIADWLTVNRCDDQWGVNWPTAVSLYGASGDAEVGAAAGAAELRAGDPRTAPGGPSRSAWCYGAPGVARSLWLAGRATGRQDYAELAVAAMEAVFRRPVPARMIDSPTFCHGVAGLLAIALRFARETNAPAFIDASSALAGQVLGAFDPASRLGFRNIEFGDNQTDQPGLLDGAAGVALVLLSAATDVEPSWDRAFLLA
jgi:hypothetical protein